MIQLRNGSSISFGEVAARISRGHGHWHYEGLDYHFDENGQLVADGEFNLVVKKPRANFVLRKDGD